jgi:large conductance mechanosensitive channel
MGMVKEFKEFALKGNVVDMAVGIIIGGAFGKIVSSLVNDIIMPPVGMVLGGVDFSKLAFQLSEKTAEAEAVTINYGAFINVVLNFLIVAFCIFMVIKGMNNMKREEEPEAATTKNCPNCDTSISIKATRCPNCTSEISAA